MIPSLAGKFCALKIEMLLHYVLMEIYPVSISFFGLQISMHVSPFWW